MEKLSLDQISENVKKDLESQKISGKVLLDRLCVIDENSRKTSPYCDHKYAPFYYYLGKYLEIESFLEIGFNIGLLSCCLLTSCKSVNRFLGFKEKDKEFIPTRLGKANIKKFVKQLEVYIGNLYDDDFYKQLTKTSDAILINEEKEFDKQLQYIETVWPYLSENGILIMEYVNSHKPSQKAFKAFCSSKNINPIIFNTRYGTGVISKC